MVPHPRIEMESSNEEDMATSDDPPISKLEQEEIQLKERLKQEYQIEDDMTVQEMRQMMKALCESKKDSDSSFNESSEFPQSPPKQETQSQKIETKIYPPSYSYRPHCRSNTLITNDFENNSLFDGSSKTSRYNESRNSNILRLHTHSHLEDLMKIDPRSFKVDPDDIPLNDECSDSQETAILIDNLKLSEDKKYEAVREKIANDLHKISMRWLKLELLKEDDTEEIEIFTVTAQDLKKSDSLRKNMLNENKQPCKKTTGATREMPDRAAKRKALYNFDADKSDSDDEFLTPKKGKYQIRDTVDLTNEPNTSRVEETKNIREKLTNEFQNNLSDKYGQSYADVTSSRLSLSFEKSDVNTESASKVTPLIERNNFKGPRSSTFQSKKKVDSLSPEEITKQLESENSNECENSDNTPNKERKSISSRLSNSANILQQKNKDEHIKNQEQIKEQKKLEELMQKDKQQLIEKKILIRDEKLIAEEKKKKDQEEKERMLNSRLEDILKNKNNTTSNQPSRSRSSAMCTKVYNVDEDGTEIIPRKEMLLCPICQDSFPKDEIIQHASNCDSFKDNSNDENYLTASTSLK